VPWEAIVGAEHVRVGGPDDAVDGMVPRHVVRVASREMLADVIGAAERERASVVAAAARAHLAIGGVPRRLDAVVDVSALSRIVDHPEADMTVTVEAGCSLSALDATLAAAGQWLPLDPPRAASTTVGGLIAANLWGPLRTSQGSVRDLLLGVRVAGVGGRIASSGGRVVKNVAGYDLPKLHVGALGTLGILVEATFKVRPRPEHERAGVVTTPSHDAAAALALALRSAMDPFWLAVGDLPGRRVGVAVGIAGTATALRGAADTVEQVVRRAGGAVEWEDDGAPSRRALAEFASRPCVALLRTSVLPTDVAWAMERIAAHAGSVPRLGHVAVGVVYALLDDAASAVRVVDRLRAEVEPRGGAVVVESAQATVKRAVDVWGNPGEGLALMRGIKAAFDPHGIFAPGRHVGGI
jgi:glycolate oxidase FAD binding subunit